MFSFKGYQKTLYALLLIASLVGVFSYVVFFYFAESKDIPPSLPENPLYLDSNQNIETRINDLLSYLTLEEKIGQMTLVEKNSISAEDVSSYGIGAILSGFGAKPENNTTDGWEVMVSNFIAASKKSRLGIPILYGADAIHGHSNVPEATIFPHSIGLGATRDARLVEEVARATAREMVATNIRWSFSPDLDLPRDIRWGRTYETFSDDPKLVAELGSAYIKGLQRETINSSSSIFVLSTPKHYIGLGGMMWGSSSNINFEIDQGTTMPSEDTLRFEYLPPFKEAVDTGVKSVMVGLNSWGKTKLAADKYLITSVLKEELGFDGFVVSDWYGVYEIPGSDYKSAVIAINAGVDMVMLPFDYKPFIKNIKKAVDNGDISESRIDDAVRRILRAKFSMGLFDQPETQMAKDVVGSSAHRALAREAVAKSLVLLKNEESVLPLNKNTKHIRIAGSAADDIGRQVGAWTVEWQGIEGNWLPGATSILAGIRAAADEETKIEYEASGNFPNNRAMADVGIAVVGENPYAEGWGDEKYPVLDSFDLNAIKRLQATSKKVVVIIVSGRPLLVADEISSWDAVVAAWLPGSEGAGVADVLFGEKTFSGVLPLPWPRHAEQLPIALNGSTSDNTSLLFPRYYGLKYFGESIFVTTP